MSPQEAETARGVRDVQARDPGGRQAPRSLAEEHRRSALRAAVDRLRRDLCGYQASLADREVAERQLAVLQRMSQADVMEEATLRDALLLIAAAVGSVSALAPAVAQLSAAVEPFGPPHGWVAAARPAAR